THNTVGLNVEPFNITAPKLELDPDIFDGTIDMLSPLIDGTNTVQAAGLSRSDSFTSLIMEVAISTSDTDEPPIQMANYEMALASITEVIDEGLNNSRKLGS